jgi:hypothetical protein
VAAALSQGKRVCGRIRPACAPTRPGS